MRTFIPILLFVVLAAFGPHKQQSSGQFPSATPATYTGECTSGADLDALPVNHWCEAPGSNLDAIAPAVQPYGKPFSSVMYAWSGAAFDSIGNRLLVHGTGHNDGAINAIYGFDLDTFTWGEVFPPSVEADIQSEVLNHETYLDGTPGAVHSYRGLVYEPSRNAMYRFSGSVWRLGEASLKIWSYDFATDSWSDLYTADGVTYPSVRFSAAEYVSEFDTVYTSSANRQLYKYDLSSGVFSNVSGPSISGQTYQRTLEWDPVRRIFVQFGSGASNHIALSVDGLSYTVTAVTPTGCDAIIARPAPGSAYDPVSGEMIFYTDGGSTSVYSYNPDTMTCTESVAAAGNLVTPTETLETTTCPASCGTFGRFRRVPSHPGVYMHVGQTSSNVVFWRHAP